MSNLCQIGGKIESRKPEASISLGFESIVLAMMKIEVRCDRAKQAVKARCSNDADFLSDEEMRDKLKDLDESYLASRNALTKMLSAHRGIRGIHQNREEMEKRSRILSEAEEQFL